MKMMCSQSNTRLARPDLPTMSQELSDIRAQTGKLSPSVFLWLEVQTSLTDWVVVTGDRSSGSGLKG